VWVEKLPSGRYRSGYRDGAGRKRQRTFLHKQAARDWARDGEEAVERGRDPEAGRMPFDVWARRWQAARVVSDVTEYNQRGRIDAILDHFGNTPLDRMSTLEIQSWEKRLDLGPQSVRLYHGTLSTILEAAVRERLLTVNPARFVQLPPPARGREVYLTPVEVDRIADHLEPAPYAVVCRVQPYLGFRWGEIAGLRVMDLDMLRRTAQVRQVVTQISGTLAIRPYPKTVSSFRTVPIPPVAHQLLAAWLAEHPRPRDGLVFVHDGQPLSRHKMSRAFKVALEAAKVGKPARPHDLRHSGASWMAQAGVPIFDISKWLGHSSISTTQRYAHQAEGVHDAIARAMSELGRGTERGTGDAQG
jgi:integrase